MKFRPNRFNSVQLTGRTQNCKQLCYKGNNFKMNMQELWFLCMTCCLKALYECMKFRFNTSNCYQVIERTPKSIANDQREMTAKISTAELWFLCMTRHLNVLYKCMKIRRNICTIFKL